MTTLFTVEFFQKLPRQTRAIVQMCLYGLVAGSAAVVFQLGMNWLYRLGLVQLSHQSLTDLSHRQLCRHHRFVVAGGLAAEFVLR